MEIQQTYNKCNIEYLVSSIAILHVTIDFSVFWRLIALIIAVSIFFLNVIFFLNSPSLSFYICKMENRLSHMVDVTKLSY